MYDLSPTTSNYVPTAATHWLLYSSFQGGPSPQKKDIFEKHMYIPRTQITYILGDSINKTEGQPPLTRARLGCSHIPLVQQMFKVKRL